MSVRIGTAGWSVPKQYASEFADEGSALERYASVYRCAEINSSFYRSHRPSSYERWASSVPEGFRFAVKMPKAITEPVVAQAGHDCRWSGPVRRVIMVEAHHFCYLELVTSNRCHTTFA